MSLSPFRPIVAIVLALSAIACVQAPGTSTSPRTKAASASPAASPVVTASKEPDVPGMVFTSTKLKSGEELSTALGTALGSAQELDVYGMAFDKGHGIISGGAGNIISGGAGNYMLLQDAPAAPVRALTPALAGLAAGSERQRLTERRAAVFNDLSSKLGELDEAKVLLDALAALPWVANGDGTETKTYRAAMSLKRKNGAVKRHTHMSITVHTESNMLVHSLVALSGPRRELKRELALQADGSYQVDFSRSVQLGTVAVPQGRHTLSWKQTIAPDGTTTGTGQLQWFGKLGRLRREATLTLSGDETAPVATSLDSTAQLAATVSLDPFNDPKASLKDQTTGISTPVAVETDAEAELPALAAE